MAFRWKSMLCLSALALALGCGSTCAHETSATGENVEVLTVQALPDVPPKLATLITVGYAPGQVSAPHRHPGSVLAYVVEGEVISQLGEQPPRHYRAGQFWYEPPGAAHLVSRNASADRPAKLVVWLLSEPGQARRQPVPADEVQ